MTEGISIAVLDNDSWSLRAIARWIDGSSPLYHVIWQTTSAAEAIHRCIYTNDKPNVLLLDMALNDATDISVCTQIRKRTADIGIIGITAYDPERYKTDLALAGGQALIAKENLAHVCNKVLPIVAQGKSAEPNSFPTAKQAHDILAEQPSSFSQIKQLSPRELQVLRLYTQNNNTSEIASQLGISSNTVFSYIHRVSKKIGTKNRSEIIRLCKKYDIL